MSCVICDNTGWVCEGHGNHPWDGVSNRPDSCGHGPGKPCPGKDCENSMYNSAPQVDADTLKLKARIEQLEAALRELGDYNRFGWTMQTEIARAALEERT